MRSKALNSSLLVVCCDIAETVAMPQALILSRLITRHIYHANVLTTNMVNQFVPEPELRIQHFTKAGQRVKGEVSSLAENYCI